MGNETSQEALLDQMFGSMRDIVATARRSVEECGNKYADAVCHHRVQNGIAAGIDDSIMRPLEQHEREFGQWNGTSLGNLCYVATHHPKEEVRRQAVRVIESFLIYAMHNDL